jgi:hypothetical protein
MKHYLVFDREAYEDSFSKGKFVGTYCDPISCCSSETLDMCLYGIIDDLDINMNDLVVVEIDIKTVNIVKNVQKYIIEPSKTLNRE